MRCEMSGIVGSFRFGDSPPWRSCLYDEGDGRGRTPSPDFSSGQPQRDVCPADYRSSDDRARKTT
jgi:hypothetical protein